MNVQLFKTVVLAVAIFSTVNLYGQTPEWPTTRTWYANTSKGPSSMPTNHTPVDYFYDNIPSSGPSGEPISGPSSVYNISNIIDQWRHFPSEDTPTEKVYRCMTHWSLGSITTNIFNLSLDGTYHDVRHGNKKGTAVLDKDMNILVTFSDGTKKILITDRLMEGVLIMRDL